MTRLLSIGVVAGIVSLASGVVWADDEVTLFDGGGNASAYIAVNDELTIYLWNGKPVAYLVDDSNGGYAVYGFNGQHLGWFAGGIVWNHAGSASCAVKDVLQFTQFEPFKAFKQFKPFKAFRQFAPFRPAFTNSFGGLPCVSLLAQGGS